MDIKKTFVKTIRKLEKNNCKLQKCHLDLRFLLGWKKANRHLHDFQVYKKYQTKQLGRKIKNKTKKKVKFLKNSKRI